MDDITDFIMDEFSHGQVQQIIMLYVGLADSLADEEFALIASILIKESSKLHKEFKESNK